MTRLADRWRFALFGTLGLALLAWHDPATAAPAQLKLGACLSVRTAPPTRHGERAQDYYNRTIAQLKAVAQAIQVGGTPLSIDYVIPSQGTNFPLPNDCTNTDKAKYDVWLELIYEQDATFVFEVSRREGEDLTVIATSPDPLPDADATRALLAKLGQRLVARPSPTAGPVPISIDDAKHRSRGILFVYDTSGSMYNTDPGARNRFEVSQTIGEILGHNLQNAAHPLPFAMVTFADTAQVLEDGASGIWFQTTPRDLVRAHGVLAAASLEKGQTNIGAAFERVAELIGSRADVEHWHVILFTDGVPTIGIMDYHEIQRAVRAALAGRGTLSVVALHDKNPTHTQDAQLADLVRATLDETGQLGEIVKLTAGDPLRDFQSDLERIAFLIDDATVRDKVALTCNWLPGGQAARCEIGRSAGHELRFGATRKVTFIADTSGLPDGACTATIENPGLGPMPRRVLLPTGIPQAVLADTTSTITLMRSSRRVSITIETTRGRLNGDWRLALELAPAPGRTP